MRHKVSGKKLSRNREERLALQRALTFSLIEQFGQDKEFITTSVVRRSGSARSPRSASRWE